MKVKRQNQSVFFRGIVLAFALAMAILCIPFDCWTALASMNIYTDYSYMTIGKLNEDIKNTVVKGGDYNIHNAYIGGDSNFAIGKVANDTFLKDGGTIGTVDAGDVVLKESSVTVSYSTVGLQESATETDEVDVVVKDAASPIYYGSFKAGRVGTYTIRYSYVYEIDGQKYTNAYELKVDSTFSTASINFESNSAAIIPSVYDLELAKDGGSYKDLTLPNPIIKDEDGKEAESVKYELAMPADKSGSVVIVSVKNVAKSKALTETEMTKDANGNFVIDGDIFGKAEFGAGKYAVKYTYYIDGNYVTSTTKEFTVYAEGENTKYYKDYNLELELASDWVDNGQTGVEATLPKATGVTSGETTPSDQAVDVYYKVKVYFKETGSTEGHKALTKTDAGYEEIIDADGYLVDASKFKPLKDGSYAFEYEIYDVYYVEGSATASLHKKSSGYPTYEFKDIKDETDPTPIVYDASQYVGANADKEKVDESYKLASRSTSNAVVVYAIGATDNVSTDGIELSRKIMTDETVSKLEIKDYDNFNLIFNYRNTTANSAYENLILNNPLIAKAVPVTVDTDSEMVAWLKDNGYRIVVDNANAEKIFDIFNAEHYFDDKVTATEEAEKKAEAIAWLKSAESLDAGFAYIDVDQTFGAASDDKGMGIGQYYIHYIAKDAAGNEKDVSKSMYVGTFTDEDIPEIKFATTLSDAYLPKTKVVFDAPTASDYYDNNMKVRTMYRYLANDGSVVEVKDEEGTTISTENLTELWADIEDVRVDGKLLTEKYAAYHTGADDGYVEITDKDAKSYTIDLAKAGSTATKLQIVTFVYDDKGNANIYGETVAISNAVDNAAPKFKQLGSEEDFVSTYEQGAEIALPEFTVYDDAVSYMNFEVSVYHTESNTKIATYDAVSKRNVLGESGVGTYTVTGGKFVASFAGNYQARIAVKDSKNKTVVSFVNYTVTPRSIIQPPVLSAALENKTVQLDGDANYDPTVGIELPNPSVSYDIPNSVTYDEFKANKTIYETTTSEEYLSTNLVVRGVDANGKATSPSTSFGEQGKFVPTAVGEYGIVYTVELDVYNYKKFNFVEMGVTAEGDYTEGGYYTFSNNGATAKVVLNDEGVYEVNLGLSTVYVAKDEDDNVAVYTDKGLTISASIAGTALEGMAEELFTGIRRYTLTSDVYTIIVKDTTGPVINAEVYENYEDSISPEEIESAVGGYKLAINSIQATDKSGINVEKSKIVVSYKYVKGGSGSHTYSGKDAFANNIAYTIDASSSDSALDGTYTITYTVYDNNGNYTTKSKTISVGDNSAPEVTFPEELVAETFEIGQNLEIDLSDVQIFDENEPTEGFEPVVKLVNKSTSEEIKYTETANVYTFEKFEEVGTYSLTITYTDAKGNEKATTFTIEVSAKSQDATSTYKVVGTILIVVSVLILAGVVIYFIASKVKLDKELKK